MARPKRSPQRKEEIKRNYARLRQAGFSVLDSQRLRTASDYTIEKAIATGQREPLQERYQKAGRGETYKSEAYTPYEYHTGRIKNSDYQDVTEGEGKMYRSAYAYLMTYEVADKKGNRERKYYTLLSDEKLTKKEIVSQMMEDIGSSDMISEYEKTPVKNSIKLIQAYVNPDYL